MSVGGASRVQGRALMSVGGASRVQGRALMSAGGAIRVQGRALMSVGGASMLQGRALMSVCRADTLRRRASTVVSGVLWADPGAAGAGLSRGEREAGEDPQARAVAGVPRRAGAPQQGLLQQRHRRGHVAPPVAAHHLPPVTHRGARPQRR